MNHLNDLQEIRTHLEAILVEKPDNDNVSTALRYIASLEKHSSAPTPNRSTWLALVSELEALQGQGLWGIVPEQKRYLDSISQSIRTYDAPDGPNLSITMPPNSQSIPPLHYPNLSPELLEKVNEVNLLHALATHPSNVLPPGKSLLSIFSSRSRERDGVNPSQHQALKEQVSEVVTRAFWDEALESLSSPAPAVQLSRIRLLYTDLHKAVEALIPASNPIMYTLSAPLSPTSSPLRSASGHIRELLAVLRERCAPIRDVELDELILRLADVSSQDLPAACIDVIKAIFDIAERMKDDLADFVIGTWTEQDARQWLIHKAIIGEQHLILDLFPVQKVKELYREWRGSDPGGTVFSRLIKALRSSESVAPFPPSNNLLPPPFIFVSLDLIRIQNLMQALVIAASLHTLVRSPDIANTAWISRVWALLEMEVDRDVAEPAETNILNLEDEVVQAAGATGDPAAQGPLRDAVKRTLRTDDPVFLLLQSRLLAAVQGRLTEEEINLPTQAPARLRTGRRKYLESHEEDNFQEERDLIVKGFEAAILRDNVKRLVVMIRECLSWVQKAWGDILDIKS
ncbi:hypothetical protein BU17DRAFT_35825 [Hysterangium stoloniferum]|nr:hypothetical protein BU17DRAFT_35825 [Hysterangium stoloniferum]